MYKQTVLIIGGSGGIGSACVKRYAKEGFHVIAADINEEKGRQLESYSNVTFYPFNILDDESLNNLYNNIKDSCGSIDHILSLAGGPSPKEFVGFGNLSRTAIEESIALNLTAQIALVQKFFPLVIASKSNDKSITLTSSINATRSYKLVSYSAAKAGLLGFVISLVDYLGQYGIRINVILPGTVETGASSSVGRDLGAIANTTSLKRITTSEEVANAFYSVTHVITSITGQAITIDAGQSYFNKNLNP
ncbi:SDR family NAD(P)-dependent oxidoreductase [Neobacillus ginsengisoli]|uniref:3-oxoacyl-[acyl-carrier protein] reductase n=1 Tax=Neobacillus ginsengisoli TaxID=904295 RepID=A0ABT9XZI4_9BACI|nr:SDR family oxidoreductase [Neobacillus ginsengisoli]MDQ0200990.1 3-oxoacyl-[acyl-carrier protein] reductase [Neobacillus ginsengisoli]